MKQWIMAAWCLQFLAGCIAWGGNGCVELRNGYFWDPVASQYFIARGIAYQLWNPPVGANQSFDQLDYDLNEFKKMYCNSVRAEFVWSQVEIGNDVYDWSKPDYLVQQAERFGLKLFVLIGFQYPPTSWWPQAWKGLNDRGEISDVLNYEHPEARAAYADHIRRVTERYKNSRAIAGWILGNEYAYFDLWEDPEKYPTRRFLGYDPHSQASFRLYLSNYYNGSIAALNQNWGANYTNFTSVEMPLRYPSNRHLPGYHDLIQWRKKSIGDFIALGATAARQVDTNHLITYSMVGGIYNGNDANNTCEDAKAIVARCAAAGAPLDFWAINNYAWASVGNEMRSSDFGIAKYQSLIGLPVMISETGHSDTETLFDSGAAAKRQPAAIPGQLWEAMMSGVVGVHLFHWNDRKQFSTNFFLREKGFGIVTQTRKIKRPVYDNVVRALRQFQELRVETLFGGSSNPVPDVQFFWSESSEMGWPRANQENAMLWGALKRAGFQPGIIDDLQFQRGAFSNAPALILSRAYQLEPGQLDMLQQVLAAGVNIHAQPDLPGQYNTYHRPNPAFVSRMESFFGINAAQAVAAWDSGATNDAGRLVTVSHSQSFGPIQSGTSLKLTTWKIWHGIANSSGQVIATHRGLNDSQNPIPALIFKNHPRAKTALNTFAIGDTYSVDRPPQEMWTFRHDWVTAIYKNHFGITPRVELAGAGSKFVVSDYRICQNGSVLLWVMNAHTNQVSITVRAPGLISGRVVENLTSGGVLTTNSTGEIPLLTLAGDGYAVLYAYAPGFGAGQSLVNPNPNKIWFEQVPLSVWANDAPYLLKVGFHVSDPNVSLRAAIRRVDSLGRVLAASSPVAVSGRNAESLTIRLPEPDYHDPEMKSTSEGASYVWEAWLEQNGQRAATTTVPVKLLWAVKPLSLPANITAGETYRIALKWEELPETNNFPFPLSRPDLFESLESRHEHYRLALELRNARGSIVTSEMITSEGTGTNTLAITVPSNVSGTMSWGARVDFAPGVFTQDLEESFEGREMGALLEARRLDSNAVTMMAPISTYVYSQKPGGAAWQNEGVHLEGSHGAQSAFMVVTNASPATEYSGFGLVHLFPVKWALPADVRLWTNFVFSYDFRERNRYDCVLEMQVKSAADKWIQFTKPYTPGPNGWDTIRASLDQFTRVGNFDPNAVEALAMNILMRKPNAQYIASFDNVRFDGPDTGGAGGVFAIYRSANDSSPDTDHDGVPDAFETNTGQFVSPTSTGSSPAKLDSDGDGLSDGAELAAGTSPVSNQDFFEMQTVRLRADGAVIIGFQGWTNRVYSLNYFDQRLVADAPFQPVIGLEAFVPSQNGYVEVADPAPRVGRPRFYRLSVRDPNPK